MSDQAGIARVREFLAHVFDVPATSAGPEFSASSSGSLLGVGIDLAEQCSFSHLDDASIGRAAGRWLRPEERVWCAAQASFREAMVIVLSCKEAGYKAWDAPGGAHELSLTMHGCAVSGWAVRNGIYPEMIVASWEVSGGSILTFAVAVPAERGWHLVERILRGGPPAMALDMLH